MDKQLLYHIDRVLGMIEPFFLGCIILIGLIGNSFTIELFGMKKFR